MLDPIPVSILLGIVGVSFLFGVFSAYYQQPRRVSSNAARQSEGPRFRRRLGQAKIPALFVFFPTAVSSILVYLFIGRAGGPPAPRVQLMEIGGVMLILGTTIGVSTLIGSVVGGSLQQKSPE